MNIVKDLQARIEKRLLETSNPCKLYKSEAAAEKAAEKMAREGADFFGCRLPARYIIVWVERVERFAVAFDVNELAGRADARGGYVGIFGARGFYSY